MRDPGSIRLHQSMFGSGSLPAILQEVRRRHCLVVTMNPQRRSQCRTSRHSIHPNGLVRGFLEQADEAEAAHPPPPLRSTADQTPFALVRRGTTAPFGFVTRSAKSASSPRNNASGVANLSMRQAWHFIKLDYRLAAVRVIETSPDQFKMTGAAACIEPASPTWP